MESSTQNHPAAPEVEATEGKKKIVRNRQKKLTDEELAGLPGFTPSVPKVKAVEDKYYIFYGIKLGTPLGTGEQMQAHYDLAQAISSHANETGAGEVTSFTIIDKMLEIALTLPTPREKPDSNSKPARDAFEKMGETLTPRLRELGVHWKLKVNSSSITDYRPF